MPTYNSEKTIRESLESIKRQNYPEKFLEVLVIDGGSKDQTVKIAKKYNSVVLKNVKKQQEYAKTIGLHSAKGDIAVFLDSDEVFAENGTIKKIVDAITKEKTLIVLSSGYRRPKNSSSVNDYINYFSDPFAHFMYGTSSEEGTKIESWKKKYKNYNEDEEAVVFTFNKKELPLVDMAAATSIYLKEIKKVFSSKDFNNARFITKLFYLVNKKNNKLGIVKDSPIIHNSADSYGRFLGKIRWRIRVNIHYKEIPGTGFSNREDFQPDTFRLKKYFFPIYAFTLLIPLYESIFYFLKYRKPALLLHLPLTIYTALVIIYEYLLLLFGVKPDLSTYGKK